MPWRAEAWPRRPNVASIPVVLGHAGEGCALSYYVRVELYVKVLLLPTSVHNSKNKV